MPQVKCSLPRLPPSEASHKSQGVTGICTSEQPTKNWGSHNFCSNLLQWLTDLKGNTYVYRFIIKDPDEHSDEGIHRVPSAEASIPIR